jgi:hypothetical protein
MVTNWIVVDIIHLSKEIAYLSTLGNIFSGGNPCLAPSDMNKLHAATIGPDGQQAWQDPARTVARVGPGPSSQPGSQVLTCSAARICVVRLCQDAADAAAVSRLRFHSKLCWRNMPCDPLQPAR